MELLRPARIEDYEEINKIARQVCRLHASWGNGIVVDYPYPMDWLQELLEANGLYVACVDNRVVGYLRFYFWTAGGPSAVTRKMISIDDIGVEESLQNQGIGKRMMKDLQQLAQEEGCLAINLYVDALNANAIAFYEKCGFRIRNHGMTMNL